jgi:hypothetical protein
MPTVKRYQLLVKSGGLAALKELSVGGRTSVLDQETREWIALALAVLQGLTDSTVMLGPILAYAPSSKREWAFASRVFTFGKLRQISDLHTASPIRDGESNHRQKALKTTARVKPSSRGYLLNRCTIRYASSDNDCTSCAKV